MSDTSKLILIVDDNVNNLQVLSNILLSNGYNIAVAERGKDVLSFIQKKIPNLILMDIVMPEMSGIEVCEILKQDHKTRDIPIIFISVHKDTFEKIKAFRAGGVDYITKPFQKEEVLARVNVHLELQRARQKLKTINQELETRIYERTKELIDANKKLEEMNVALKVLLEKKEEHKDDFGKQIVFNVRQIIEPYLDKLRQTPLTREQATILKVIEKKIKEVVSPYEKGLSQRYGLTPAEIQIVELIRAGKPTKEIADILGLSKRTVDTHRHNIRKKLGILNKNINLVTYLSSLEREFK
ncbi:hypothetical protein JCM13304A_10160 [Desulfothermus okinawensis JCM 13304]